MLLPVLAGSLALKHCSGPQNVAPTTPSYSYEAPACDLLRLARGSHIARYKPYHYGSTDRGKGNQKDESVGNRGVRFYWLAHN